MNKTKTPTVEVILDKPRTLLYNYNTFAEIEDVTKLKLHEFLTDGSAKTRRAILWAGLLKDDPSLTLQQVGEMVTTKNLQYVEKCIAEAMAVTTDEVSEEAPLAQAAIQ